MENTIYQKITENLVTGRDNGSNGYSMKECHFHDSYEIYYLVSGNRNYIIDGKYYTLSSGDVAVIEPGIMHKTTGGAFERDILYFTCDYMKRFFTTEACELLMHPLKNRVISLDNLSQLKFEEIFEKISDAGNDNQKLPFIYLAEILRLLESNIGRSSAGQHYVTEDGKMISRIMYYINEHFADIDNISQISDHFYISKYHLCRIFKEATSMSVIEYLNRVKIKRACTLLQKTNKSITEICMECGFNSSVYFCKLFKKLVNLTPSRYRETAVLEKI